MIALFSADAAGAADRGIAAAGPAATKAEPNERTAATAKWAIFIAHLLGSL
jgi:hypothetical protein